MKAVQEKVHSDARCEDWADWGVFADFNRQDRRRAFALEERELLHMRMILRLENALRGVADFNFHPLRSYRGEYVAHFMSVGGRHGGQCTRR